MRCVDDLLHRRPEIISKLRGFDHDPNVVPKTGEAIRGSDVAIRLGGDEFLAVLPECKPEEVRHVLGRLTGIKTDWNGQSLAITFSSGWTNFKPGESLEDLVKRADDALYVNKRAGREQAAPTAPLT